MVSRGGVEKNKEEMARAKAQRRREKEREGILGRKALLCSYVAIDGMVEEESGFAASSTSLRLCARQSFFASFFFSSA